MFSTFQKLILASSSPRRHQFLHNLGIEFTVVTAELDETPVPGEPPDTFAKRMAREKAFVVGSAHPDSWVIGADTVVTLEDGTILGKPANEEDAINMLRKLNNTSHRVFTGLCLCCESEKIKTTIIDSTDVAFMDTPLQILERYVRTGEPLDKAGAYGIQGIGSFLVKSINGSCTNVIGLPVSKLIAMLLHNRIIGVAG